METSFVTETILGQDASDNSHLSEHITQLFISDNNHGSSSTPIQVDGSNGVQKQKQEEMHDKQAQDYESNKEPPAPQQNDNIIRSKFPKDLDLADVNELVGIGVCGKVWKYVDEYGRDLALKTNDLNNNPKGYKMMVNEVEVYKHLESLQGKMIPVMHWYGYCRQTFVIATTLIDGEHPDYIPNKVRRKFESKLLEFGIVHGDLRPRNVLVDKNGKYWLIDFGRSRFLKEQK